MAPEESPTRQVDRKIGLPSGRAVIGGLLMALAAVGTFVAYQAAAGDDRVEVLVAARDLRVGDVVSTNDVRVVAADLPAGARGLFGSPMPWSAARSWHR
jgi:flagella basal body P-ring formation protein FlgA